MSSDPVRSKRDSLVPFFVITFVITWGVAALLVLFPGPVEQIFGELSILHPLFIFGVWSPTISAVILTLALDGWAGLRSLIAGFARWRVGWKWYLGVMLGIPLVAWGISQATGSQPGFERTDPAAVMPLLIALLVTGPLGEEVGWRGFALPRLLNRARPLTASLILGIIWGIWHLPSFFLSGLPQDGASIPAFLFMALCLSCLATWIYIRTGGSILMVALFHLMVNAGLNFFGAPLTVSALVSLAAAAIVIRFDQQTGWLRRTTPTLKRDIEKAAT